MENAFKEGSTVERNIDGVWFSAVIENVDLMNKLYTIKYSDDGNVEDSVTADDLRLDASKKEGGNPMESFMSIFTFVKKDTLPKPLAGLVEDDSEFRRTQKTTATIHTDADTEQAIIINGTADRIAVGGGLRALRYLKN
jgi:hypothetical protein